MKLPREPRRVGQRGAGPHLNGPAFHRISRWLPLPGTPVRRPSRTRTRATSGSRPCSPPAGQQERANNTRTFLAVEGLKVIGYYATTTYRLGLDEVAAMHGVGSMLLLHALKQIAAAA
jgi:hypothetical protein